MGPGVSHSEPVGYGTDTGGLRGVCESPVEHLRGFHQGPAEGQLAPQDNSLVVRTDVHYPHRRSVHQLPGSSTSENTAGYLGHFVLSARKKSEKSIWVRPEAKPHPYDF